MLQQQAERADDDEDDGKREEPVAGDLDDAIADVAAEQDRASRARG